MGLELSDSLIVKCSFHGQPSGKEENIHYLPDLVPLLFFIWKKYFLF